MRYEVKYATMNGYPHTHTLIVWARGKAKAVNKVVQRFKRHNVRIYIVSVRRKLLWFTK